MQCKILMHTGLAAAAAALVAAVHCHSVVQVAVVSPPTAACALWVKETAAVAVAVVAVNCHSVVQVPVLSPPMSDCAL